MIGLQQESIAEFKAIEKEGLSELEKQYLEQARQNRLEVWKALFEKIDYEHDPEQPI